MTREEINALDIEALETRANEIAEETATADIEQLETLNAELDVISERREAIRTEIEDREKAAAAVVEGAGKVIEVRNEEKKMTNKEVRNSQEYIEAYAKYVRTGKDLECRALLTEAVEDGVVPVPEFVENTIMTAWENDEIFNRVSKTFVPGNDKQGFEVSATDAAVHTEGAEAPDEEELVLGIVDLVPDYIKKWISVSDKALAVGPQALLQYLYDEIEYKIVQKAADIAVAKILAAPSASTTSAVGVAQVAGAVDPATILQAIGQLSQTARDRVFIASGTTIAAVQAMALQANYAFDPFFGLTVIQNDTITDGAIIGDLAGVRANLPEGGSVRFIFDEYSLAEADLVKIVGKMLAAIEVVGPKMFAVITGDESES